MTFSSSDILLQFYQNIDIFLLILVRLLGFMLILPVFAGSNIPVVSKIGVAFFIAVIVILSGSVGRVYYEPSIFGYCILIAKEFIVGFVSAFSVYMVFSTFYFVGQLVDYQIGFSMVSVFDPISQIQVPITGNLFYLIITFFFVQFGGLNAVLYTIAKSFEIVPLGMGNVLGNPSLMRYGLDLMSSFFAFGVKIALPIVGTILVVDIALGLLTKAVPQMNVFVVGIPIKLFIGMIVLYLVIPAFYWIYTYAYDDVMKFMMNMLRGMMP